MKALLSRLVREEEGQDLIEYALLAAFIAILSVAAITLIGQHVQAIYEKVETATKDAAK